MKSRRTQIIVSLATIILVAGFVLVPGKVRGQYINTGASNIVTNTYLNAIAGTGHDIVMGLTTPGIIYNWLMGKSNPVAGDLGWDAKALGLCTSVSDCVKGVLIVLSNISLSVSNLILSLAGTILNGVMILTINMATLLGGSNNIIDASWSVIRDMASIIIIFFLLYTSIEIIIGVSDSKVKHIIIMVAIAGILINFSLFFTKAAIDASNLVGLAFYRAIAPSGANFSLSNNTGSIYTSGGIANEFMAALNIQTADAYKTGSTEFLSIFMSGLYGTILQLIAAFVFLAAAFLFIIRIGLLTVLLIFSPFYFIGLVVPKIEEKISKPWLEMLTNQCLILPIFMFFMYIAIRVITNKGFQTIINPNGSSVASSAPATVGMFIQFFIAIILICISLVAALKYASVGKDLVNKGIKNAKAWSVRGVQKGAQQTAGRASNYVANKIAQSDFAKTHPDIARTAAGAANVVATASFGDKKSKDGFVGGEKKRKEGQDKSRKDFYERMDNVNRENFAFGDDGQKAYETAKKAAFDRQAKFIDNMKTETIMSRMMGKVGMDENPNARSQYKLEKDYNADYGKEYSDKITSEMKSNREELTKIAELLDPENTLYLLGQNRSVETLKADKTRLESRNKDLDKFQDAAARRKEADALKEIAKSVNELSKKDKQEEGGDSKKEKPEKESGGDKDKPKP